MWGPPVDSNGAADQVRAPHLPSNPTQTAPAEFTSDTPVKQKQNGAPVQQDTPQQGTTVGHSTSQNFSTPTVNPPPYTTNLTIPATAASIPTPNSTASAEVQLAEAKAQLAEYKAQVAALTKQLEASASGLRHRNVSQDSNRPVSAREVVQTAAEQGVPVKIVAYLCLAAFLLAYLFF